MQIRRKLADQPVCIFPTLLVFSLVYCRVFNRTYLQNVISPRLSSSASVIGVFFSVYSMFANKSCCSCTMSFLAQRRRSSFSLRTQSINQSINQYLFNRSYLFPSFLVGCYAILCVFITTVLSCCHNLSLPIWRQPRITAATARWWSSCGELRAICPEPQTSVSDQVGERTTSGGCSDFHIRHMAGVWYPQNLA